MYSRVDDTAHGTTFPAGPPPGPTSARPPHLTAVARPASRYLVVVPVRAYAIDDRRAAMESAFCRHLRELLALLHPHFDEMTVATVGMPRRDYEANRDHLGVLDAERDRIRVIQLYDADLGAGAFLRKLPSILTRLRGLVRGHGLVHSGPSHDLRRPVETAALMMAVRDDTPTVSVTDIDLRSDAMMNRYLRRWSLKSYLLCRYVYDPIRDLQHRWVTEHCSLVLFKSEALRADFGRDRPNVRTFQDVAVDDRHFIGPDELAAKVERLRDPARPLHAVYFGRLVDYKGVDRCIEAVARARQLGREDLRLTIIGNGEARPALEALTAEHRLQDRVVFRGAIPYGEALFAEVRPHHVMLAAPLSNDTPRSTWDAMASGTPTLAFGTDYYRDLERTTEVVETVPWPSTEALGERLAHYAANREALVPRIRAAVEVARDNTSEIWLKRRVAWTRELLDGASRAA